MEKWEVGPTKDVVQALMETLLDPRLPSRVSVDDSPSEDAQKSVAKQIHAVVLLYNYYHRKQKLELEFLDFVSFSKLALSLRPSLIPFMKMIKESDSVELTEAKDQLSVTEKAIKDACDIALSLDASKDVPSIEEFPISKVAVLLIDLKKENCWLQFGAITEGVWALFEKEINESSSSQEILGEENVRKKRKTDNQTDYSKRLHLGFDAVKDVTGIDSSDLVVWETRVVYSLTKEKSAAQFYLMQCSKSLDINQSVPLSFLVENLQGPLAEKFGNNWMTTTLVEYHHMLPYVGFISDWLSRKDVCVPILDGYNARSTENNDEELPQSTVPALPRVKYLGEDLDQIDTNGSNSNGAANENSEDHLKKSKRSSRGKTANEDQSTKKNDDFFKELKNIYDILNSKKKGPSKTTLERVDNDSENHKRDSFSDPSRLRDENDTQRTNTSGFTRSPGTIEERTKLNSNRREEDENIDAPQIYNPKRKINQRSERIAQNDARCRVNLKVNHLKSNDSPCRDENITAENGGTIISRNQRTDVTFEVGNTLASKDLQNALALLEGKKQELYSKICTMEDTLALYHHYIDRIKDGGEVGLARECIKCIITGDDHLLLNKDLSNFQSQNLKRSSGIYLPGTSSCQDLEYICLTNKWRLPRYSLETSDGKFVSNVVVISKEFNLSLEGGLESTPNEAKESAAACMITKIRDTFGRS